MRAIRNYAWLVFGGAGLATVIHIASFASFIVEPQQFYYRAWEWFEDFPYRSGYFTASWNREERGDLANSHLFLYNHKRVTRVTTDRFGFRRSAQNAATYEMGVSGDSTIWGSGLSDDETLPSLIAQKMGQPVFNAGRTSLENGLKHPAMRTAKVVIHAITERHIHASSYRRAVGSNSRASPLAQDDTSRWRIYLQTDARRYSPIARIPGYLRRLGADLHAIRKDVTNEPYLFLPHQFTPRDLSAVVPLIVSRHRILRERGIRYIFVAVPAKQTIYRENVDAYTRNYLFELDRALRANGVETVNLLESFLQHKTVGLFQPYDTHWNPQGVELAARIISTYLSNE
jgi:hypothetical protein